MKYYFCLFSLLIFCGCEVKEQQAREIKTRKDLRLEDIKFISIGSTSNKEPFVLTDLSSKETYYQYEYNEYFRITNKQDVVSLTDNLFLFKEHKENQFTFGAMLPMQLYYNSKGEIVADVNICADCCTVSIYNSAIYRHGKVYISIKKSDNSNKAIASGSNEKYCNLLLPLLRRCCSKEMERLDSLFKDYESLEDYMKASLHDCTRKR